MSCRYRNRCPSYSGWCEGPKQDFSTCVEFLITAYENEKKRNEAHQELDETTKICNLYIEAIDKLAMSDPKENEKKERIRTFIIDYDSAEKFAEFLYSIKARFEYCEKLFFVNFQVVIENDEQQVIVDNWVKNHYKRDYE